MENLRTIFHLSSTWWAKFSADKSLLGTRYRRICLSLQHRVVSPEIINLIFEDKNTLRGYSQSDYHLIHWDDIHWYYLISFQVFNMLKSPGNKSCLKHRIFHCRTLHLVFPFNNRYFVLENIWAIIWYFAEFFSRKY